MIIEREILEDRIENVASNIYHRQKVVDEFCICMLKRHGVDIGTSMDIIGRNADLRELSIMLLLWITKELGEAVGVDSSTAHLKSGLMLDKYFTDIQINQYSNMRFDKNDKKKFPIVIEKVLQVNHDQFVTVKNIEFIKDIRDRQIAGYNRNTQRELTAKKVKGEYRLVITIIKRAVAEIQRLMLDNKFISNAITFNINADEPAEYEYDEDELILTIYSGKIDILDGYHRYLAMTNVKDNNPDWEYNTILNIMNFSEDKSKMFIVQEDKRNKIKKSKIKSMDNNNNSTIIVNNLNESSKSNLRGLIGSTKIDLIDVGLLVDLIEYNFPIQRKNNKELIDIKNYTIEAFNILVEDNTELVQKKQNDLIWVFYIRLMKDYYDSKNFEEFIDKIHRINQLDINNIGIKSNVIGATLFKKVDNILENI